MNAFRRHVRQDLWEPLPPFQEEPSALDHDARTNGPIQSIRTHLDALVAAGQALYGDIAPALPTMGMRDTRALQAAVERAQKPLRGLGADLFAAVAKLEATAQARRHMAEVQTRLYECADQQPPNGGDCWGLVLPPRFIWAHRVLIPPGLVEVQTPAKISGPAQRGTFGDKEPVSVTRADIDTAVHCLVKTMPPCELFSALVMANMARIRRAVDVTYMKDGWDDDLMWEAKNVPVSVVFPTEDRVQEVAAQRTRLSTMRMVWMRGVLYGIRKRWGIAAGACAVPGLVVQLVLVGQPVLPVLPVQPLKRARRVE